MSLRKIGAKIINLSSGEKLESVHISIAIPVRNGGAYLSSAISTALSAVGPDGEVVVSLNACTDDSEIVAHSFDDYRLIVLRTPRPMSMSAHWEFLLSQLRGEWIVFIGHDDAVIPNLSSNLKQIESSFVGVDAILFRRAMYFWPGVEDVYKKTGWRFAAIFSAKVIRPKWRLLNIAIGKGSYEELPMVYSNSLVHRSVIERVKRSGDFFCDLAPDVYSSVAVSLSARKAVYCAVPSFWVGCSPSSNGLSMSKFDSTQLPSASPDQEKRATDFLKESASDGYSLGRSVRSISPGQLTQPLLVLSALENCARRPWWTRGALMRRLLLQHDFEMVGVRESLEVANLPFQVIFSRIRRTVTLFNRLRRKSIRILAPRWKRVLLFFGGTFSEPREISIIRETPATGASTDFGPPAEINRFLEEQGALAGKIVRA